MSRRLARTTGIAGLLYVAAVVVNIIGTTDGPRPDVDAVKEAARITAESTAIRWSALLGVFGALAFCAFTTGLALLVARSGRGVTGAALAVAGIMTGAIWIVSFAALAAAAQSAQTGARPDVTLALGALHSVTLLASFATAGACLLAAVAADVIRTRTARAVTTVIACAGVASAFLVLDVELDTGRFGVLVTLPFFGVPIWVAATSVRLVLGRLTLEGSTDAPTLTRVPKTARWSPGPQGGSTMKRMFIAVVSMLSVYGLSGAVASTGPATADTVMHTRRLVLHSMTETSIEGANTFGGTDVVKVGGTIVGYDAISGRFYPKQTKVILHLAFALKGGILICRLAHKGAGPDDETLVGPITKGSGKYNGVTGTITWREVKRNKVRVTLRYHY